MLTKNDCKGNDNNQFFDFLMSAFLLTLRRQVCHIWHRDLKMPVTYSLLGVRVSPTPFIPLLFAKLSRGRPLVGLASLQMRQNSEFSFATRVPYMAQECIAMCQIWHIWRRWDFFPPKMHCWEFSLIGRLAAPFSIFQVLWPNLIKFSGHMLQDEL